MAPPVSVRVDVYTDLVCFGGTRVDFVADVLNLTWSRTVDNQDQLTMTVPLPSPALPFLVALNVLRLVMNPSTADEEWRITGVKKDRARGLVEVTADWPLIDLGQRTEPCRSPAATTDDQAPYSFEGIALTPAQHFDNYLLAGFPAPWSGKVVRGTFDPTAPVDLVYDWDKPLKILKDLARLSTSEISYRRNGSTDYRVDLLTALGASLPVLDVRLGKNMVGVVVSEDENRRATGVLPRSALVDGVSYGISENRWQVAAINAGAKTVDVIDPAGGDGPIAFDHQYSATGMVVRLFRAMGQPDNALKALVTDSAIANQRFTLAVDPTGIFAVGDWLCIGLFDGSLNYLPLWKLLDGPQARTDPPVAVLQLDDVATTVNFVKNAAMRIWTGGAGTAPDDWGADVGATITKLTSAADYLSGGQSARLQTAAQGLGLAHAAILVTPTAARPYFTASVRFRITALTGDAHLRFLVAAVGGAESADLPDPTVDNPQLATSDEIGVWKTLSVTAKLTELGASAFTPDVLALSLRQEGTGTADFIVDSLQVTQTPFEQPFVEGSGGNRLIQAGNKFLAGARSPQREYEVSLVDLGTADPTAFPQDPAVQLGQTLRVTDPGLGVTVTSLRVMRLTKRLITEGASTPASVTVIVGQPKSTAASVLAPSPVSARQGPSGAAARAHGKSGVQATQADARVVLDYRIEDWEANRYGSGDSSVPYGNAMTALLANPTRLGRIKAGAGTFNVKNRDHIEDTPGTGQTAKALPGFAGEGIQQTILRAPPSGVIASDYIQKIEAPALGGITSLGSGGLFCDYTIEGRQRGVEYHGLFLNGSHVQLERVHFRSINGSALKMGPSLVARECQLRSLIFRHCGRHSGAGGSTDEPCFDYTLSANVEGHNLIQHTDIQIVYPWYSGLRIRGGPNFVTRKLWFEQMFFHGFEALTGTQQGRLSSNSAMIEIDGECDNIKFQNLFTNHSGSDDAQTGLGPANWSLRIRNTQGGLAIDNLDVDGWIGGNCNRGGMTKIEAGRLLQFRNIQIDGTPSNEFVAGHLYAPAGTYSKLRLGSHNLTPALMTVAYADGVADKFEDEILKIPVSILADTDPLDTLINFPVYAAKTARYFIQSISYRPSTAITGSGTDYFRLIFTARGPALNLEIGRIESTTTIAAHEDREQTVTNPAQLTINAGEAIWMQKTNAGAGAMLVDGIVTFLLGRWISAQA